MPTVITKFHGAVAYNFSQWEQCNNRKEHFGKTSLWRYILGGGEEDTK